MAKLSYSSIASLDGYIADKDGKFDWAMPDAEVHAFVNDLERPIGTYLYGRRMYEVMVYWETAHTLADEPPVVLDFARIWQAADKVVYSTTLEKTSSAKTRIDRRVRPREVRQLKESAERDLTVGGAELAAQALKAGLVDEYHLIVAPIAVGGGTRSLPADLRVPLELLDERRFGNGMVHLHYRRPHLTRGQDALARRCQRSFQPSRVSPAITARRSSRPSRLRPTRCTFSADSPSGSSTLVVSPGSSRVSTCA